MHNPLTLVSAPAGYGKSVLISQWLEQTRALHTWVSIDDEMNELRVFMLYFRAAIEKIFPGTLNKTHQLLKSNQLPPLRVLTNSLLNELDQLEEEYIVVLDDYHHIHDEDINQLIDNVLRFPPEHMHLVLIARRDPPLRLHAFRSQHRITEIRTQDLAFNESEIISLFQQMGIAALDDKSAQILHEKTEGWIVGLRLVSMSINNQNDLKLTIQNLEGDIHLISEFLMEEVFAKLPPEMKEALLYASILDRFSHQLLDLLIAQGEDEITQELSGEEVIQYLFNANLFIIPLDAEHTWFRFHHLFQDVLQKKLNGSIKQDRINQLHYSVSEWLEKHGFISEAIHHATESQNFDLAKGIIEKYWISELNKDRWFTVTQWLPLIPDEIADNSVSLSLWKAQVYYLQNSLEKIPPILERINEIDQSPSDLLVGFIACLDTIFSFIEGRLDEAIQFAEKALSLIPKEYHHFRSDEYTWLVLSLHMTGKGDLAFKKINKAISVMDPPGEPIQLSRYVAQKAFLNLINLDFEKLIENVIDFSKIKNLNPYTQTFLDYLNASIHWWSYHPDEVIKGFDPVIENQYQVEAQLGIDAFIAKALSLQELGRTEEAKQLMDRALDLAEEMGIEANLGLIRSGYARLALLQGDIVSAENHISTIRNPGINPFSLFWIEIPAFTICRVKIALGSSSDLRQALELLSGYREKFKAWNNKLRTVEIASLQAAARFKLGEKENALKDLKYAIENAADSKILRPFVELGSHIKELLITLKDQSTEAVFVESIIESISAEGQPKKVLTKYYSEKDRFVSQSELDEQLSPREQDILVHVSLGLRNKEIANKLYVSTDTIKKHLYNAFRKLQVNNRIELVNKAKSMGLIES
jgi:LuxR family maltose regulon positive regulatory protein